MMIALPRVAPPIVSIPFDVVRVRLVDVGAGAPARRHRRHGRHDLPGTTLDQACTIGMVACPPQVIMLGVGASRCSRRLARRHHRQPTAAGVRSIATIPAASYFGAYSRCTYADVASKIRSGKLTGAKRFISTTGHRDQSAIRRPLHTLGVGIVPTIQRGSITSDRSGFVLSGPSRCSPIR